MTSTWLRRSARWTLTLGVPLVLLATAWRLADPRAGLRLLGETGPWCLVGLLPYALVLAADSTGWRLLFAPGTRAQVPFSSAFASRTAADAVSQTLPSAGLAGEAAAAWLLSRRTGLPLRETIASVAARRVLIASGQAVMLTVAAVVSMARPDVPGSLVAVLVTAALALSLAAMAGSSLLARGQPFARLRRAARRLPWTALPTWAGAASCRLRGADRETARLLGRSWRPRAPAVLLFALVFAAETLETFLLLRLLGAPVTLSQAVTVEPLASLLRALAFFAPAGLGIQDLGYVALFRLVHLPGAAAVSAAFMVLKRLKELVWVSGGWGVLLAAEPRAAGEGGGERNEATDPLRLRHDQPDDADAPGGARAARA